MSSYKVIADESALREFLNWLPNIDSNEVYYAALTARSKYVKDLGLGTIISDRHQCSRIVTTKDRLYERIWRTEAPLNSYSVKGVTVPQEALAMYINPNPRSLKNGRALLLKRAMDSLFHEQDNYDVSHDSISCIHKSISKKNFVDFDFDDVDLGETVLRIAEVINVDCVKIIETRGGFHALVKVNDVDEKYKKSWYREMSELPGVDFVGDMMLPVPGTYQGMFVPKFKTLRYYI